MHKKFRKAKNNHPPFRLRSKHNYLGFYACLGALGLLTLAMLFPLDASPARATDSDQIDMQARLTIGSSLSVSLQEVVDINVTSNSAGEFGAKSTDVTVSTSAKNGYGIYVNTKTGAAGSDRMVNTNDATKYVSPISGVVTPGTMPKNTWGYTLQKGAGVNVSAATVQYKPVPLTAGTAPVLSGDANTSGTKRNDTYTLGVGAKVDNTLPSGTYTSDITVSVIAKPEDLSDLRQITYMQEMTTEICKNTPSPTGIGTTAALTAAHVEKQLIDERDGKAYFVTKMADGNCWMTQNLALDIDGRKTYAGGFKAGSSSTETIDGQTTIVVSGKGIGVPVANTKSGGVKLWTGNAGSSDMTGILPKVTGSTSIGGTPQTEDNYDSQSWNFGNYVLTTPLKSNGYDSNTYCKSSAGLSNCGNHVTNVGSYSQVPYKVYGSGQGYKYSPSSSAGQGDTSSPVSGNYYDAHYLIGIYYQYNAAMAGSAGRNITTSYSAPNWSICPAGADADKNWRPAKSANTTNNGLAQLGAKDAESYAGLLTKYGITSNDSTNSVRLQKLPLVFSCAGYSSPHGFVDSVGRSGAYWSSTIIGSTHAYALYVDAGGYIDLKNYYQRYFGLPLRCLYPGV